MKLANLTIRGQRFLFRELDIPTVIRRRNPALSASGELIDFIRRITSGEIFWR